MRIALLAPLRFPIAEPYHGGLEMHTHQLAHGLRRAGHEVTLFAHPDSDPAFRVVPVTLGEKAGFLAQTAAYRRAMRRIRAGNFAAVHNNSIHFLPPLLAGSLRCPVVTTLHTPPYKSLRWGGRYSRAENHTFVSISRFLREQWRPWVGEHPVVHNGVEPARWPLGKGGEKTAVWYGRFTPEKGAEYAIAIARAAGYRLTLAGPVYDETYYKDKIAPELGDDVVYAGHLTQGQLAELVGRSAVCLVTSVWDEPFGLVYVEAALCGTPVVAFASGAAAEVLGPEMGVVIPKRDIGAGARVLGGLTSGGRTERRRAAAERFSAEAMVERYGKLYFG